VKIRIEARHMDATDPMKEYIETKADKLPRILDEVHSVEVTVERDGEQALVEFIVHAGRKHTFVASHRDKDMYACIDQCLDKITQQLRRHKDKVRDHQGPPHSETMRP